MKSYTPPPIPETVVSELRSIVASGSNSEQVIAKMRGMGFNKIASIKLLRTLFGISLGDAKVAVHYSPAWADCREADDALHEAVFAAAEELQREEAHATEKAFGHAAG